VGTLYSFWNGVTVAAVTSGVLCFLLIAKHYFPQVQLTKVNDLTSRVDRRWPPQRQLHPCFMLDSYFAA
ncbi:hypothetical protein UP10_17580, partial [Bradyrhizobium sp. LTSPM299]|uniref:hypothetical protein n=1 Tax=Bradyrhizobium sp. LTSPM299 TaxID=1619233 RepID=UPI0005C9E1E5